MAPVVNTYPISNYSFGSKEPELEKETSVADRAARMKDNYTKKGMRSTVVGIIEVQEHNHPHILLLQDDNIFCRLPGVEDLKRKLTSKLLPSSHH